MFLYVNDAGVRVPRWLWALIAAVLSAALAVTMSPAPVEAAEPGTAQEAEGDGAPLERPDVISAAATARAEDERVEVVSLRTESAQTFVNPDGTHTVQDFFEPVRLERDGRWVDVDYTLLEAADGSWVPKASPVDVRVNGGGAKEAARVTFDDGKSLAVTWPEVLPEPTVEGGVATYALSEATDLVVAVTGAGVTARLRLNEAPAEEDPVFTFGLRAEGVEVSEAASGLEVTDGDGEALGGTSSLVAWDARTDDAGAPAEVVPLEVDLQETGVSGDVTRHELELTTPEGFLSDPDTQYPAWVDPDISTLSLMRDTWVRRDVSSVYAAHPWLGVGRANGSTNPYPAETYMKFQTLPVSGKEILKAELGLWQYYAPSCADRQMNVHAIEQSWGTNITYTNRPSVHSGTGSGSTSTMANRGGPDCARGWTKVNMRNLVSKWASGEHVNEGIRLSVPEANSSHFTHERRFCSMDPDSSHSVCNTASRRPYLSVTYNGPPNVPGTLAVSPSTSVGSTIHTSSSTPTISAPVSDGEGQNTRFQVQVHAGGSIVQASESSYVASGGTATKELSSLADGTYQVRLRASDKTFWSAWGPFSTMVVDTSAPAAPTVSCSGGFTSGTWYDTRPSGSTTCTVTGAADVAEYEWTRAGKPQPLIKTSGGAAKELGSFTIPGSGVFGVGVKARDAAGNASPVREFGFGTGDAGLVTPTEGERTSSTVTVEAEAPAGAVLARVEHRAAGTEDDWVTATAVRPKGSAAGWFGTVAALGSSAVTTGPLVWDMAADENVAAASVRDTRVCFVYEGVQRCTPSREVTLVPAAFGGSFPTQDAGPGQVALFTGELQVSESDVSVPGYGGDLSLGRSHRSLAGASTPAAEVFGPGWVADLAGPEAGQAAMEVIDRTTTSASITLVDPEGGSSTYVHEDDTASAQRTGYYVGDAETETDNDVLQIESRSGTKYLTLLEEDGTETEWKHLGSGQWVASTVEEPFANGTTSYTHDADGLVTGIYAPAPSGVTCTAATQQPGCRALQLTYTTVSGNKRLTQVDLRAYDPKPGADGKPTGAAAMVTVPVAKYEYDGSGLLTGAWDPRLGDGGSALKTTYEYTTAGSRTQLTKATPAGETPWRFGYGAGGRLVDVKRAHPAAVGSGDATWRVSYGTDLNGPGLPDLSASATSSWGQSSAPVGAATVYGPDAPASPEPSDGTISYWDVEGRTTNTASYGAGAWQVDSTVYDAQGNEVWSLDEGGRARALTSSGDSAAVASSLATITTYNTARTGLDAGARVETVQGPTRQVMLEDGTLLEGRSLSSTVYDDEAAAEGVPTPGRPTPDPEDPALNLPVEEREGVADAQGNVFDVTKTRYEYAPVVAGDGDGWESGSATRTKTQLGSGWSTEITRSDTDGKVLETRTPQGVAAVDGTANDTRSRKSVYYTADGSAADAACRNAPQWAGLECLVGPAGQPGGNPIPVTRTTGYDYLLSATRTEETSGSTSRASVTAYHLSGRSTGEKTTVTGAPTGDQPVADVTYAYSPSTGAPTSVVAGGKTQATTYDAWGRVLTQSDGSGNTATTTYDTAGRVKTLDDGKGVYTYTYDGTDAAGKTEKRGLVTGLKVGLASGGDEFAVAHDADANAYLTRYPNGIEATTRFDAAGAETSLGYVDGTGTEVVAFSQVMDRDSKVRQATSPASEQSLTYDGRDRLTRVQDTTALGCTTRTYGFSLDSNRTSLATAGSTVDGSCTTSGASTVTAGFDAADRITTSGYGYDNLGRTRTVPAVHTDQPEGGDLSVAYHGNDMVARLAQTVPDGQGGTVATAKAFTLDPVTRLSTTSDTEAGVELRKTTNHYADGGDAPAWVARQERADGSSPWAGSWTRNVLGPDGDLAILQDADGTAKIQIVNLHGDVVTQLPNTATVGAIDAYDETTEYGLPRTPEADLGQHYGWLGAKRRSTDTIGGLTLMGVRLYNPTTGRFLSMDPVYGGNDNTYTYPVDPINLSDLDGRMAYAIVAGLVGGVAASQVIAIVGVSALITIGVAAGWKGRKWAKKQVTKLYNKAKKKVSKKSKKAAATDVPSYAKGAKLRPGESLEAGIKRVMGSRYPTTAAKKRQSKEYSKIKKHLTRK